MKIYKNNSGFTLVELMIVVGIIAVLMSVVVPMGLRASVDAKYGMIRQNGTEIAGFATQWAEKSIHAQDDDKSEATLGAYYASLAGEANLTDITTDAGVGQWIATTESNNWNTNGANTGITGRYMDGDANVAPEDCVQDIIPSEKAITNPFTKVNVFKQVNYPSGTPIPGALALGAAREAGTENSTGLTYFAFVFQGKDSEIGATDVTTSDFYAGMDVVGGIPGLRNGIFVGRF